MDYNDALVADSLFDQLEEWTNELEFQDKLCELRNIFQPIIENEKNKKIKRDLKIKHIHHGFEPLIETARAVNLFNEGFLQYEAACQIVENSQAATQDILHAIEFFDLSDEETLKNVAELKKIRRVRRESKNYLELTSPMYQVVAKYRDVGKELNEALKEMHKVAKKLENRTYTPRILTEMEVQFRKHEEELKELFSGDESK